MGLLAYYCMGPCIYYSRGWKCSAILKKTRDDRIFKHDFHYASRCYLDIAKSEKVSWFLFSASFSCAWRPSTSVIRSKYSFCSPNKALVASFNLSLDSLSSFCSSSHSCACKPLQCLASELPSIACTHRDCWWMRTSHNWRPYRNVQVPTLWKNQIYQCKDFVRMQRRTLVNWFSDSVCRASASVLACSTAVSIARKSAASPSKVRRKSRCRSSSILASIRASLTWHSDSSFHCHSLSSFSCLICLMHCSHSSLNCISASSFARSICSSCLYSQLYLWAML